MCGRARLSSDASEIRLVFKIPPERPAPNFAPSWKVAPTDPLPIVRYDAKVHQRSLDVMRWGLVPFWAKDIKVGFANQRQGRGHRKQARFPRGVPAAPLPRTGRQFLRMEEGRRRQAALRKGGGLMALAGLWETWRAPSSGERVRSFAIVTTEPNELCAQLHNRIPWFSRPRPGRNGSARNRRTRRI